MSVALMRPLRLLITFISKAADMVREEAVVEGTYQVGQVGKRKCRLKKCRNTVPPSWLA
jgi:hypothetical protein